MAEDRGRVPAGRLGDLGGRPADRGGEGGADIDHPRRRGSVVPRCGTGARIRRVGLDQHDGRAATAAAAARTSSAFLNVTMPLNERYAPRSSARRASSGPPVKQWNTVRAGTPASASTRKVSSHASREWITSARSRSCASATWARNATSCSSARSSARSRGRTRPRRCRRPRRRLPGERLELRPLLAQARGVVRVEADGRPHVGVAPGELDRPPGRLEVGAHAHHGDDPGRPGLGCTAVVGVVFRPVPIRRWQWLSTQVGTRPGHAHGLDRGGTAGRPSPAARPRAGRPTPPPRGAAAPRACRRARAGARAPPRRVGSTATRAARRPAAPRGSRPAPRPPRRCRPPC